MRIAINAWFWNQPTAGSGQYTRRLVNHLVALEPALEILLVAPQGWGFQANNFSSQNPNLEPETWRLQPEKGNLKKVWFEQIAFPRACRQLAADAAHVPYWAPPLAPAVPTLVTIHDLIPLLLREYRGGPRARAYTALVAAAASSAALILTDSEASRQDILTHLQLPPEKVQTILLAAEARYHPHSEPEDKEVRARYGLPPRYHLYLGGFDARKNVATALRTYTWAGPVIGGECPLAVAGRLPAADTSFAPDPRRQAAEMGLDPRWVRFTDTVAETDKPALYRGATAFLFPSRYEGFGLPPLEAMACGTPVVGSGATSLLEVVGGGGILLPPDDAEGMAGALIQLAQDDDFREQLSQQALAQAGPFSWQRTARETLAAYRQVIERAQMGQS
ncbi:MAG: glycosyltransferase family 4 protein [Anaerolineae bacterium]|nr:glycosyltransferase family 4 protein [Anaerolineae bacterium]